MKINVWSALLTIISYKKMETGLRYAYVYTMFILNELNTLSGADQCFDRCQIKSLKFFRKYLNPSIHCSMGSAPIGVQCPHFLTRWVSGLLGLALVSWAIAHVGVHHISLRLPYLSVFPFTRFHLPLNFILVSSLRLMYLHPSVDPSLIHFLGECPGLGLALVPGVVVPEAET